MRPLERGRARAGGAVVELAAQRLAGGRQLVQLGLEVRHAGGEVIIVTAGVEAGVASSRGSVTAWTQVEDRAAVYSNDSSDVTCGGPVPPAAAPAEPEEVGQLREEGEAEQRERGGQRAEHEDGGDEVDGDGGRGKVGAGGLAGGGLPGEVQQRLQQRGGPGHGAGAGRLKVRGRARVFNQSAAVSSEAKT